MHTELLISLLTFGGTLLLVVTGLLNFSVFVRQLRAAREQLETARRQLESARQQPQIQLVQRAMTETSDHLKILIERPYLRPYFYENKPWVEGDVASLNEVKAMAELVLNNFASAIIIPPIRRSISVSWDPEAAFKSFTAEFASWWPTKTHSIGGERLKEVVFEQRSGGRIYEEHLDGRRFQWGEIVVWEPPHRLKFTWHPSRDPATAQEVEIKFVREDDGTRLELTSTGWEKWGKGAGRARRGYDLGWKYVLNVWAGRRTKSMAVLDSIEALMTIGMKLRGGRDRVIAKSGGEILPAADQS